MCGRACRQARPRASCWRATDKGRKIDTRASARRARRPCPPSYTERIKTVERENRELRQANEILRKASAYFAQTELDRRFRP